ncbi:E3 ubiquitin-protein ligase AIP2-like [Momordica charantia]|uniref:RING-type E3 ubiquitin transferase n=1 Tax=Momordica charantia TaxID=3673 RepID=A0A6J1C3W1_MOMCH|nr:E3 ubiquitin-protein ligase AIP2-like [Momordica charantia]
MAHLHSRTGDRQVYPRSTDESHSSLFHALISGVNFRSGGHGIQLNLARDILQRQAEQSSLSAWEEFTSSNLAIEDAGFSIQQLDSDFERLIALLEHERPNSTPPSTIHDADSNILEEFLSSNNYPEVQIVSNGEWSLTIRTAASRTVIESLLSVVLREEDVVCSICMEWMKIGEEAKQLPCIHRYHGGCIRAWLEIKNTCPICRYELPKD